MSPADPTAPAPSPAPSGRPAAGRLRLLPILDWLRRYRPGDFLADARAAVNVALLDFPQGMAYALIAGLPIRFGIFASILSSLTGPLFASSRFVMLGPTNSTAVLLFSTFLTLGIPEDERLAVLPLLVLLIGVFLLAGALFRAAVVIQFVSRSVLTGYITAAACLIIVNQLQSILGEQLPETSSFLETLYQTVLHLPEVSWPALSVALITAALYLALKRWLPRIPGVAVTLALVSAAVALLRPLVTLDLSFLTAIQPGSWQITPPPLDPDLLSRVANGAFAIAFLSILESSSIAKTLAARSGDRVDLNQQMVSIGMASLANAFGSGMPASGSLTRSALNHASGARTPVASMISGALLFGGLFLLGPVIGFIPSSALAALVVLVGLSLIRPAEIRLLLRATKSDASVFLLTFASGLLFALDTAIYVGTIASIVLFLHKAAHPQLVEYEFASGLPTGERLRDPGRNRPEISLVHVEGDLFFGSTDLFLDQIRLLVEDPNLRIVLLRLKNAYHMDATSALAIADFLRFARQKGRDVLLTGMHPEIARVLRNTGVLDLLGADNVFAHRDDNPNLATALALRRAQAILGLKSAEIRLFTRQPKNAPDAASS